MIAYLSGTLLSKHANSAIVDVGGVGYELSIPLSTFYELGDLGSPVHSRGFFRAMLKALHMAAEACSRISYITQSLLACSGEVTADGAAGTAAGPTRRTSSVTRAPGPHPTSRTRWPGATPTRSAKRGASGTEYRPMNRS